MIFQVLSLATLKHEIPRETNHYLRISLMAKPSHKVKKANHGKRPANNRGRKIKNKKIKTP
jgi:hypothetical protein